MKNEPPVVIFARDENGKLILDAPGAGQWALDRVQLMKKEDANVVADALRILGEYEEMKAEENHKIMTLKAEIRARGAAIDVVRGERDHLEEGLRLAKEQIDALQKRINELQPIPAGTDPAALGKEPNRSPVNRT